MLARPGESFTPFEGKGWYLEWKPTDPIERTAWLTISLVIFLAVDEYREVVVLDNLLRLRLRRIWEVMGAVTETRLATARIASPRPSAGSMVSRVAST